MKATKAWMSHLASNWVRLAPNATNLGILKISFSTFWLGDIKAEPKCTETDLKKSQICPIWGQSETIWMQNLPSLARRDQISQWWLGEDRKVGDQTESVYKSGFTLVYIKGQVSHWCTGNQLDVGPTDNRIYNNSDLPHFVPIWSIFGPSRHPCVLTTQSRVRQGW